VSEKRFPPSARGLREAKARGDLGRASYLTRAGSLCGVALGLWLGRENDLFALSREGLSLRDPGREVWLSLAWSALRCVALGALGALVFGALAGGFAFSPGALRWRFGNPLRAGRGEFWLGLALWLLLAALALWSWLRLLGGERLVAALSPFGAGVVGVGVLQAVAAWWMRWARLQRSVQEVLREQRDDEGDKAARQRLRALLGTKLARQAAPPKGTGPRRANENELKN
jgi:hypothetical protein